jgi:hypothetical protein
VRPSLVASQIDSRSPLIHRGVAQATAWNSNQDTPTIADSQCPLPETQSLPHRKIYHTCLAEIVQLPIRTLYYSICLSVLAVYVKYIKFNIYNMWLYMWIHPSPSKPILWPAKSLWVTVCCGCAAPGWPWLTMGPQYPSMPQDELLLV